MELGSKPLDPKATDEIRKKILNVLGLPPRGNRNDDGFQGPSGGKWETNVELFKEKLKVEMIFKETKSKYYLLMNGAPENCTKAIAAAEQLFEKGYSDILTPGMTQESFSVADKDRGILVGPKGAHLNAIQDHYSVQINLPRRDSASDVVVISGPTEGVKGARATIQQLISTGISDVTHPDSSLRTIEIPNRRKAALIGTKGSNIRRIQDQYSCRINVPKNEAGTKSNDKVAITISGDKELIDAAVADILESIAEPEPEQVPGFSKELTLEYDPWADN